MIEDKFKLLGSPLLFNDKLDIVIDAFVEFYGEDKRSYIEQRFKNILILKFCNTSNLESIISDIEDTLIKETFSLNENEFIYFQMMDVIEALDKEDEFSVSLFSDQARNMLFNGEKDSKVIIEKYKNGEYPLFSDFRVKYLELKEKLLPYEKLLIQEKEREREIEKKYFRILISEYRHLFNDDEVSKFEEWGFSYGNIATFLGNSLSYSNFPFGKTSEDMLNDSETVDWRIESIKEDRVRFLQQYDFNLGDILNEPTYEDYLNNEESYAFILRMNDLFTEIENRKKEINELRVKELVYGLRDYIECQSIIESKGFVNKNDALGSMVYQSPISCCELNFTRDGDRFVESGLILMNAGMTNIDQTLIHELNHAYETFVLQLSGSGSVSLTGWDTEQNIFYDRKMETAEIYTGITRPYELMSEYINDRISDEIKDIMYSKGNYIVENTNKKSGSSYRFVDFLLEDFYQDFKPIIIQSRSGGNIQYIHDMLGKDNFDELNNLVNKYFALFGFTFDGRIATGEYFKGEINENSEKIGMLVSERDEILAKMHEHLKSVEYIK